MFLPNHIMKNYWKSDKEVSNIINDLFVDDTLDIIEEMPSNVVIRILKLSDAETRHNINKRIVCW